MFSTVLSAALLGIEGIPIYVEADVVSGLPMFEMVGYLSSEVKEAKERVKAAIRNSGVVLTPKKITVNLSPADIRKAGAMFDLPVAVAVLAAMEIIDAAVLKDSMILGELSLNGEIRHVNGVLPIAMAAKELGCKRIFLPEENEAEASAITGLHIIGLKSLAQLITILKNERWHEITPINIEETGNKKGLLYLEDFADINGQLVAKRAAEIAASGMHNILFVGPPGAGKTMIAKRIPTILPDLTFEESLTLTKIYSVSGNLPKNAALLHKRPFRNPHHTITKAAFVGGGITVRPGEISLSHSGILFLDELPEYNKSVLETMRQPMEDRCITLVRGTRSYTYPTNFMLVAAMNPCQCGYYPDLNKCTCTMTQVKHYRNQVSKPLMDRIDMAIELPKVNYQELTGKVMSEHSETIKNRVEKAHHIQRCRYQGKPFQYNATLPAHAVKEYCSLGKTEEKLIEKIYHKYEMSARAYHKILKVARTIADLAGEEKIHMEHISEAICYRILEQNDKGR